MAGGFGMLWKSNPEVSKRLGCATAPESGGAKSIAEQRFANGSMLYFQPDEDIYVFEGFDSGSWQRFTRAQLLKVPTPLPTPPPIGDEKPVPLTGGFGLIWYNFPEIANALGEPASPEDGLIEGAFQPFQEGVMLYSRKGLKRGKTIYVLYKDGSFERYDDPNK